MLFQTDRELTSRPSLRWKIYILNRPKPIYRSRFQTTNRQRNIKGDTNEAVTSGQGAVARLTENATLIMALAVAYSSQFYIL